MTQKIGYSRTPGPPRVHITYVLFSHNVTKIVHFVVVRQEYQGLGIYFSFLNVVWFLNSKVVKSHNDHTEFSLNVNISGIASRIWPFSVITLL